VPIPLLKDLLKPCLEMLPRDMQSSAIIAVDRAQREIASNIKRIINDHVISVATNMASQFQADLDPNKSASSSKDPMTSLGVDSNNSAGNSKDPVTPLDDGSPYIGDLVMTSRDSASTLPYIGYPVNPSRVSASLPPYPFLSSRLSAIDAVKVPASAARILSSIRKRRCGKIKMSAVEWPYACKELSQRFIELAANRNMIEQEKK
jgi:hypothetical protein